MGLWSRIKQAAKKVYTTVKSYVAPAPAPAPAPTPSAPKTSVFGPVRDKPVSSPLVRQMTEKVVSAGTAPTASPTSRSYSSGGGSSSPAPAPSKPSSSSGGGSAPAPPPPQVQAPASIQPQPVYSTDPATGREIVTVGSETRFVEPFEGVDQADPFFSIEGQKARIKNAFYTPVQALGSQFGLMPDIESDEALLKWLANNPLVTALGAAAAVEVGAAIAASEVSVGTISTVGLKGTGTIVAANSATAKILGTALGTVLSKKALLFYGAWASSVAFGKWGQGEAIEQFTFNRNKFYIPQAIETGDWSLVDASNEAAEEFRDPGIIKQIALWSPISGPLGAVMKLEALPRSQEILNKYTEDKKFQQGLDPETNEPRVDPETGQQAEPQSEDDFWAERRKEQVAMEKEITDYYNEERRKQLLWEEEQKDRDMREDAEFWAKQSAKERALMQKQREEEAKFWAEQARLRSQREAEDRIAMAKFWLEYREMVAKIEDNSRPSNLNFGLL